MDFRDFLAAVQPSRVVAVQTAVGIFEPWLNGGEPWPVQTRELYVWKLHPSDADRSSGVHPFLISRFAGDARDAGAALFGAGCDLILLEEMRPNPWPILSLMAMLPAARVEAWIVVASPGFAHVLQALEGNGGAVDDPFPRLVRFPDARVPMFAIQIADDGARREDFLRRAISLPWQDRVLLEEALPCFREISSTGNLRSIHQRLEVVRATGRPMLVWGAGSAGQSCVRSMRDIDLRPVGFVDSDPGKRDALIEGLTVSSPSSVMARSEHRPFLVVASTYASEIEETLCGDGWIPRRDFIRYPIHGGTPMPGGRAEPRTAPTILHVDPAVAESVGRDAISTGVCQTRSAGDVLNDYVDRCLERAAAGAARRLALVSHEASRTGAPMIALDLVRWLRRTHGVFLLSATLKGGALMGEFAACGPVINIGAVVESGASHGDVNARVARWMQRLGIEAVLLNSAETWPLATPLSRAGIPVVTLIHEFAHHYPPERLNELFGCSRAVIFPASAMRRNAAHHLGMESSTWHVLPQGLLPSRAEVPARVVARAQVLAELGLDDDTLIILGCGTVNRRKGTDLLPSIAARVVHALPHRRIAFVWLGRLDRGAESIAEQVEREAAGLGLAGVVFLLGERDDPSRYFSAADIFILPSREDPFPCVVHEAMAAGIPVVAFADAGGIPELLQGGAGMDVPYMDVDAFAAGISALADDAVLHARMAERARQRVHEALDFDRYGRELWALVEAAALRDGLQPH